MEQLDLEDYIKEKKVQEEKKPGWVTSSYKPVKRGDLVEYTYMAARGRQSGMGLVLETIPANVYESAECVVLKNNGQRIILKIRQVKKIT